MLWTGRRAAAELGPAARHQVWVPPQHRGGSDDPMQSTRRGQQPSQRREHRPIRPRQSRSPDLTTEHGNLMPQQQDLRILRPGATSQQPKPEHELPEEQIEQSYGHDQRSCRRPPFSNTTGHRRG
jgi:hypothetical protein